MQTYGHGSNPVSVRGNGLMYEANAVEGPPVPQVITQIDKLEKSVYRLGEVLETMRQKLSPVIAPPGLSGSVQADELLNACPLAAHLYQLSIRVDSLTQIVNDTNDAIQL